MTLDPLRRTRRRAERRDTATGWSTANPILAAGEIGVVSDLNTFKIGDGETAWNDLDYPANPTIAAILETIDTKNEEQDAALEALTSLLNQQSGTIETLVTQAELGTLDDFTNALNGP